MESLSPCELDDAVGTVAEIASDDDSAAHDPDERARLAAADPATLCALNSGLLRRLGEQMGFALTSEAVTGFERYAAEMVVWNARTNLTRITRPDEIAIRHFLDSLVCLRGVPEDWRVKSQLRKPKPPIKCIDVGAGPGLPGLALKLVRPDWAWTLVDSSAKKVAFMSHVAGVLQLDSVEVVHARAEEVGRHPDHRARYDLAVARAVGSLPVLAEFLLPLLKLGGRALALKGEAIGDEVAALERALVVLGGRVIEIQPYTLSGLSGARHLVVIEKTKPTQERFPRRAGTPERDPLGN